VKKIATILLLQGYIMASILFHIDIKGIKIPVIFEQDNRLPLRDFELVFQNSGYLASKTAGLASLSSQLLNEGTKKDGSIEFARRLENHALHLSTGVGQETLTVTLSGMSSEFDFGLNRLKELLQDPNYTNDTFKKVLTKQIGKLMQKESNFDYVASNNLRAILFEGTPLALPELGTKESLKSIKLDTLKDFIDSHLHLDNLIVVAGGDFKRDELEDSIKNTLEPLSRAEVEELPRLKASDAQKEKKIYKDTEQAYIYFGAPFDMEANSTKRAYSKVASFILGSGGFGSRLMEEIRVKRGLAYSAYSRFVVNKTNSYLSGYLQTKLSNADKAKKVVVNLINEFVKNGVTQDELDEAKKFYLGSEPLRSETLSQKLHRDFLEYYNGLGLGFYKKELKDIKNMELKDLNDFIKSHPEITKLSFSIVTKKEK